MRVQRYDFFLNHQNFSKKKSLFPCIFYALLIYVNTQNDLHLIIYYIGRAVLAKSQEQRTELQTQEKPSTPFWLVISPILLFTGCAAGILFIKKRRSPQTVNSQEGKIYETEAYLRFKDQSKHPQQIITKEDWKALEVQFSWTSPFRICIHDASNY